MATRRRMMQRQTADATTMAAAASSAAAGEANRSGCRRRSNSWCVSDWDFSSDDEDGLGGSGRTGTPLADRLTSQRWHEVGEGPHPIRATDDFDQMVDQLSSILAMRLRNLLVYWMGRPGEGGGSAKEDPMASTRDCLRIDSHCGDYVLTDSVDDAVREYVAAIGRQYNDVGFHNIEHCAHVTIGMNKLLSMVMTRRNGSCFRERMRKRVSERQIGVQGRGNEQYRYQHPEGGGGNYSFGIADDPRILFAMVFSALIHDVGHTGVPNSVLVEEEDDLAILHNDVSVAEQNSLQVAFSLLQREEFACLKKCICPTPAERKFFRKWVINMVMVTDISDQERIQIVKSRWNAAFPHDGSAGSAAGGGDNGRDLGGGDASSHEEEGRGPDDPTAAGERGETAVDLTHVHGTDMQSSFSSVEPADLPPRGGGTNTDPVHRSGSENMSGRDTRTPELRDSMGRRRQTTFASVAAAEQFAKGLRRSRMRLGIRTSMDFSGMPLDAYKGVDELQRHAVLETMMNVADVSHCMQSFRVFREWNRRLFRELHDARAAGRLGFDPADGWYRNQIGFFDHYILPLSRKMRACGAFGTAGDVFEYFAAENRKRWEEEGERISEEMRLCCSEARTSAPLEHP